MKPCAATQLLPGPVGLHFMNRPKWAEAAEHLWVGHYLTFEPSEVTGLSRIAREPDTYAGVLLLNHHTHATIRDCRSGVTLSDTGKDITLANRFWLSSHGQLRCADYAALFSDGQSHLHFQIANTPMRAVFGQMPGFAGLSPQIKRDPARRTRGSFSSRIEARILAAHAYDVTADFFESLQAQDLGNRFRIIDGHEAWGAAHFYFGVCEGGLPKSWNVMAALTYETTVDFDWDNSSTPSWSFRFSPGAEPGHTRASYAAVRWNAVDLLDRPCSDEEGDRPGN